MWNSRRVKRIVGSISVVTMATVGLSLTDVVEENTYAPLPFEVIDKALAQTKSDLRNIREPHEIPRMACYYGSPEFFKKKREEEENRLRYFREKQKQEEMKGDQKEEEKEEIEDKENAEDTEDTQDKEGNQNGDNK